MLFTTLPFLVFFAAFFLLYWFIFAGGPAGGVRRQNVLLLVGSYCFYCWWDWRFVFLLAGNSLAVYFLGGWLHRTAREGHKSLLVGAGLSLTLGSLLYFKYFHSLLPLGLSFYTFRMISYLVDIRKAKTQPARDLVVCCLYIAFFPCLLAGPIDRPAWLIPQLESKRAFRYEAGADGMRQILWGLFKKIVIADNCAAFSADIFAHYATLPASALVYGALMATIWVYADFSGYSDMAIGFSRLLGFEVTPNFNYPFFATNIAGFWRRWHITLTSWMTDYVFTPLNILLRDLGKTGLALAILLNFTLIGLWHGPSWTYVGFGFLNGCYFLPMVFRGRAKKTGGAAARIATFLLVAFSMVLFRSASLSQALGYYRRIFSGSLFSRFFIFEKVNTVATLACIVAMFIAEWTQRDKRHALQIDGIRAFPVRALIYFGLMGIILTFAATKNADFIYFRF
ncbi:MAG TPA: MBOAT family O-acyltransferase [Puia sp.]|nr:MBOAT family O-acyltransferase [Puia sp.]